MSGSVILGNKGRNGLHERRGDQHDKRGYLLSDTYTGRSNDAHGIHNGQNDQERKITLMIWENTVARAAPDVPIPITSHKSRSPAILQTQAIATVISGVLESPNPLNIQPIRL